MVFGVQDSALPLIRGDLKLSYAAIGLLLSAPALAANLVEIPIGLLADSPRRRRLVLWGGVLFAAALVAVSLAPAFGFLVAALVVLYPASGAFVALSQADLMDADTTRREQNMARWNLAGSLGALAGPGLLIAALVAGAGGRPRGGGQNRVRPRRGCRDSPHPRAGRGPRLRAGDGGGGASRLPAVPAPPRRRPEAGRARRGQPAHRGLVPRPSGPPV